MRCVTTSTTFRPRKFRLRCNPCLKRVGANVHQDLLLAATGTIRDSFHPVHLVSLSRHPTQTSFSDNDLTLSRYFLHTLRFPREISISVSGHFFRLHRGFPFGFKICENQKEKKNRYLKSVWAFPFLSPFLFGGISEFPPLPGACSLFDSRVCLLGLFFLLGATHSVSLRPLISASFGTTSLARLEGWDDSFPALFQTSRASKRQDWNFHEWKRA